MEIARHLTNEEMTEFLQGDSAHSDHVRQCPQCQAECQRLQLTLGSISAAVRSVTDREDRFWLRQQAAIRSRIAVEQASRRPWAGFTWATAAAVLLLVGMVVHNHSRTPNYVAKSDPDQELLVAVEQAVDRGGPEALEPAALLADDISNAARSAAKANQTSKENRQ
jgi:hypothetical protein